ncbi:hypothetical protein L842_3759 [Mycobacterium intracellulare MIN_052511_1280]|nr:hypothetical protein L842_3759 [Mycobacterium intracellulare MIN_052511_1280]
MLAVMRVLCAVTKDVVGENTRISPANGPDYWRAARVDV